MAGTELRQLGGPGELVDVRRAGAGLGQAVQGDAEQVVGDHLADGLGGARLGVLGAVAADHLGTAVAAGHGSGEGDRAEPVDPLQEAAGDEPEAVLVAGPAEHQVDVLREAGTRIGEGLQGVAGHEFAVDHDPERGAAEDRAAEPAHLGLGAQQQVTVDLGEGRGGGGDLQPGGHPAHHPPYLVAVAGLGRPALQDRPPEQPLGLRGGQQGAGADRAGRLSGQRHPPGVAAEGPDRLVDPLQGGELVAQAGVGGGVGEQAVALHAEPVVHRDEHDTVPGEGMPVVHRDRGGSPGQGAAVQPDQDREPGPGAGLGGPHVEVEAVVARHERVGEVLREGLGVRRFRCRRPEGDRVAHAVPGLGRLRRPEAAGAEGRGRVGDAAKDRDAVLTPAAYGSVRRADHGVRPDCRHAPASSPRYCTMNNRAPHFGAVFRCRARSGGYLAYIRVPKPSWSKPPLVVP